jgi:hypothetical protein
MNPWLGARRGHLSDWTTQQWVRATGRVVGLADAPWLRGPCGRPTGIGEADFERYAADEGFCVEADPPDAGLLDDLTALRSERFDPAALRPEVASFYERTGCYQLQLWSQWSAYFRPFGKAVDAIFARRLGQLQLPLSPLDTSRGVSSRLIRLRDGAGETQTVWLRRRLPEGEMLYAGLYSVAQPPLAAAPCVKVTFPLPNGNASVFLDPVVHADGSLELISAGDAFGGAGFYFVVARDERTVWAKHVPQLTERIRVYPDEHGGLHTDHVFRLWGRVFLRLHYAMPRADRTELSAGPGSACE